MGSRGRVLLLQHEDQSVAFTSHNEPLKVNIRAFLHLSACQMEPTHFFTLLPLYVHSLCRYIHVSGDDRGEKNTVSHVCQYVITQQQKGEGAALYALLVVMLTQELQISKREI